MSTLEVKVRDHIIPQVTRFKYLKFIVQKDGEIEAGVNHRIQVWWLKWTRGSCVFCDKKVPLKLTGKSYRRGSVKMNFLNILFLKYML